MARTILNPKVCFDSSFEKIDFGLKRFVQFLYNVTDSSKIHDFKILLEHIKMFN